MENQHEFFSHKYENDTTNKAENSSCLKSVAWILKVKSLHLHTAEILFF